MNDPKIIVALDYSDPELALRFSKLVSPDRCKLKIGKELFTSAGPVLVKKLVDQGFDVFLDLKFHDIPNTVKKAISAASKLGVWMVNVHAMGGTEMMLAAREGADMVAKRPFLIAVTVLTSMNAEQLKSLGISLSLPDLVESLAMQTINSGLDGVVCSAQEVPRLRTAVGESALLVTPGIRPEWAKANDQQRIVTPQKALADGASYLVIGRPITEHKDPLAALDSINQSIS